jgi:hypothetical protein
LSLSSNKSAKPSAPLTVDISLGSQNVFAAVMQQSPGITQTGTGPETRSSARPAEPVPDDSHHQNTVPLAVTVLGSQTGQVGNAAVFKDQAPVASPEMGVEAFSLVLHRPSNLPESTVGSITPTPILTTSSALSQETPASPAGSQSANTLALGSGLQPGSNADLLTDHTFSGTNPAQVIEKGAPKELAPPSAISTDHVSDQTPGLNSLKSIVSASRAGDPRVDAPNPEDAAPQTEHSSSSDNPRASTPGETRMASIQLSIQTDLSSGYSPGRESGIGVPVGAGFRTPIISGFRPSTRSRNIVPADASPYRSNSPAGEDASGLPSDNTTHGDNLIATLSTESRTNYATGESQAEPAEKTSGFTQNSSQGSPSAAGSPDASPKGEMSPKVPAAGESFVSSRPASQPQHENPTSQSAGTQPFFPSSSAGGAISTINTTRSSSETQSSSRGLPIDLTESGKSSSQAAGPVKEISIRVQASSGETVHLKVVDQVNQVQIGVRSSNETLAANLRQDLSSLTATLDRLGWKSEPASAPALVGTATTSEAGSGANDQSDSSHSQTAADWWNNPEQNRRSPSDLWEEALNR